MVQYQGERAHLSSFAHVPVTVDTHSLRHEFDTDPEFYGDQPSVRCLQSKEGCR